MEQKYWWNKYYKRCHISVEEAAEYGFTVGEPMQDGYEPTFEDFVEVKARYVNGALGDGELQTLQLGQDGKLYLNWGPYMSEVSELDIQKAIHRAH